MSDYYVDIDGKTEGPVTVERLRAMRAAGEVYDDTLCAPVGAKEWTRIKRVLAESRSKQIGSLLAGLVGRMLLILKIVKARLDGIERALNTTAGGAGLCFLLAMLGFVCQPLLFLVMPMMVVMFILGIVLMAKDKSLSGIVFVLIPAASAWGMYRMWSEAMASALRHL